MVPGQALRHRKIKKSEKSMEPTTAGRNECRSGGSHDYSHRIHKIPLEVLEP